MSSTTQSYPLSLHDALPISLLSSARPGTDSSRVGLSTTRTAASRSEEHTSELQSRFDLVCRLLLEKKSTSGPPPHFHHRDCCALVCSLACCARVLCFRVLLV